MTLQDLRQRVYWRTERKSEGLEESAQRTLDSEILDALNMTMRECQLLINFGVLRASANLTLAAGTQTYNLATDFNKMCMVWNNSSYDNELLHIIPQEYKTYLSDVDTTRGVPLYYDIYDNATAGGVYMKKIALFPVPSAIATAPYHYWKRLADLSADTDENILSELYPDLLIEGSCYYIYRDLIYRDMPEKIAFRMAQYQKQIDTIKIAQRQVNRIDKVLPKRLTGGTGKLYSGQYTGYTS